MLLQGIPSEIFELDTKNFTFSMRNDFSIENLSFSRSLLEEIFDEFMKCGQYFLSLKEFSSFIQT